MNNPPPVEEPKGCVSVPGFVKSMPDNNDFYVEQFKGHPWYPAIAAAHKRLTEIIPGYNITQIKNKFGGLRYYIDYPLGTNKDSARRANEVVSWAEAWVDGYEARKREETK